MMLSNAFSWIMRRLAFRQGIFWTKDGWFTEAYMHHSASKLILAMLYLISCNVRTCSYRIQPDHRQDACIFVISLCNVRTWGYRIQQDHRQDACIFVINLCNVRTCSYRIQPDHRQDVCIFVINLCNVRTCSYRIQLDYKMLAFFHQPE